MICLPAAVRSERGVTGKSLADSDPKKDCPEKATCLPVPDWVVIEELYTGFFLNYSYLREGPFIHTWHPALEEAKDGLPLK